MFKKTESIQDLEREITACRSFIKAYTQEVNHELNSASLFTGRVFVTFEDSKHYSEYYGYFSHSMVGKIFSSLRYFFSHTFCACCFSDRTRHMISKKYKFKVEEAPEPTDIIWENLEYSDLSRFVRKIVTYTISLLIVLINLAIVIGLNCVQVSKNKNDLFNF